MTPPKKESNFEITPEGNHVARFYQILHIGTITEQYQGEDKEVDKVRLTFELSNEKKEFVEGQGEKPFVISQEYTYSMNSKANLRRVVEGIIGASLKDEEADVFDLEQLLGNACLLNVVHKTAKTSGREYALIKGTSPLPKGTKAPEQINESVALDVETVTDKQMQDLPEFVRNKIADSKEYKERHGIKDPEINPDDIPFD